MIFSSLFTLHSWFRVEGASSSLPSSPSSSSASMPPSGLRQVLPSNRVKYHLEVLILLRLLVEDSGVYVCIVNNTVGSRRVEVELVVTSPLETRVSPVSQTVDLGRPAVFRCAVLGHPVKEIGWYKDGVRVQGGGRRYRESTLNATLEVYDVQEGDEGAYQCVARNDEDDEAQSTGQLWLGDASPLLLYHFNEVTLQPGESTLASLKCIAKGNPTPAIRWLLDGFRVPRNDDR